mgnify:CR=1 FL=1
MLRKLFILAVILAIVGFGVFWGVTMPATVPASALPQRTASLDNGKTMLVVGGCSSCHATPEQDDKTRQYLHRGIAARQFQRTFVLADGMEVLAADLKNGLLSIDLARPEPERTVRSIAIADNND